eukprot:403358655
MKNILILLKVIVMDHTSVKANELSDFRNLISNVNSDTCLAACTEASAYMTKMFTSTEYTDSKINQTEFFVEVRKLQQQIQRIYESMQTRRIYVSIRNESFSLDKKFTITMDM